MPSDAAVLVPSDAFTDGASYDEPWLVVSGMFDEALAVRLSAVLRVPVVVWSMTTVADHVWIRVCENGVPVRELQISLEHGWEEDGAPRAFEDRVALAAQRKRLRGQRWMIRMFDGYEVLKAFLGGDYTGSVTAEVRGWVDAIDAGRDAPSEESISEARRADRLARIVELVEQDDVSGVAGLLGEREDAADLARAMCSVASARMARLLLERGGDPNMSNSEDPDDRATPLNACTYSDDAVEIARVLLEAGAEVDASDDMGETALMGAVDEENSELVQVLMDAGAAVDSCDREGVTALMRAHAVSDVASLLIDWGADPRDLVVRDLFGALDENDYETIRAKLSEIDMASYGRAVLCALVRYGDEELVEAAVKLGADPRDGGPSGSALAHAEEDEYDDTMAKLLRKLLPR